MNNTNAKLKLTFDWDEAKSRARLGRPTLSGAHHKDRFWEAVEHAVGTWRKFIRKAIKFYEVFGGLNKYINSRDFSVLS